MLAYELLEHAVKLLMTDTDGEGHGTGSDPTSAAAAGAKRSTAGSAAGASNTSAASAAEACELLQGVYDLVAHSSECLALLGDAARGDGAEVSALSRGGAAMLWSRLTR